MRAHHDFSKGVRAKYFKKFRQGTNLVILDPDVSLAFPNSSEVNKALRELIKIARKTSRVAV